ncbi:lymphocyte transmembrane adapter 1 isoform X2 [Erinaceus europaeus]|uniref:Lymphocyte transmembrane adapter 1 isoform X2 n=1 Tax=Erinaceus europaeus TaxID=9365 RepID=A0ABM3WDF5_ERIEU|nr:lymphocyte transmembrane adapter 1 isoform X2 [Erinaceus europaeus]
MAPGFPPRNQDWSSSIIPGFLGLLTLLLFVAVFCVLWNRNRRKKRQVPYYRVTAAPLTSRLPPRPRAKNIYDLLPRRQEESGRHQPRSTRVFSTENLLSRNSDGPFSELAVSHSDSALQVHRDNMHARSYSVDIYDNALEAQMPSAHYINVSAPRGHSSTSSEDSRDYINIPTAEVTAETYSSSPLGNLFVLPSAQQLEFTEERGQDAEDAENCTKYWPLETGSSDPLSDGELSSQTSNDYVNMAGIDLGVTQGDQPGGDYENILPADLKGKQQQGEEEATPSTDHVEGRTGHPEAHIQLVTQSGTSMDLEDYVSRQPAVQNEKQQMNPGEETSHGDCNDYENMLVAELGDMNSEQGLGPQLFPEELSPSHPDGTSLVMTHPSSSIVTTLHCTSCEDP